MKKFIIAAIATAMALPAMAADPGVVLSAPQFQQYDNRGQCVSALAAERNRQRKDPASRGQGYQNLSESEFNKASLRTTRCELRNGKYVVLFYQNGFPN